MSYIWKMKKSLTSFAHKEIGIIHRYSRKYNNLINRNHSKTLLELMQKHVDEIARRFNKGDKHYIIETGDLLILCFELLKEVRYLPDIVLQKCYKRYRKKLPKLIKRRQR